MGIWPAEKEDWTGLNRQPWGILPLAACPSLQERNQGMRPIMMRLPPKYPTRKTREEKIRIYESIADLFIQWGVAHTQSVQYHEGAAKSGPQTHIIRMETNMKWTQQKPSKHDPWYMNSCGWVSSPCSHIAYVGMGQATHEQHLHVTLASQDNATNMIHFALVVAWKSVAQHLQRMVAETWEYQAVSVLEDSPGLESR